MSNDLLGLLISLCQFPFPIFSHSTPDKEVLKTESEDYTKKRITKLQTLTQKNGRSQTDSTNQHSATNFYLNQLNFFSFIFNMPNDEKKKRMSFLFLE
jgi:hypothetical protein